MLRAIVRLLLRFGVKKQTIYNFWRGFLWAVASLRMDLTVEGLENLPETGPRMVIFNHVSMLDAIIMLFVFPGEVYGWVADEHSVIPVVSPFIELGNGIPIVRDISNLDLTEQINVRSAEFLRVVGILKAGHIFAVSPEGTRNKDGILGFAKFGIGYVAALANCHIIPAGIDGSVNGMRRFLSLGPKVKVTVRFGEPFKLTGYEMVTYEGKLINLLDKRFHDHGVRDIWQRLVNEQMMPRLAGVLPNWMRGAWKQTN